MRCVRAIVTHTEDMSVRTRAARAIRGLAKLTDTFKEADLRIGAFQSKEWLPGRQHFPSPSLRVFRHGLRSPGTFVKKDGPPSPNGQACHLAGYTTAWTYCLQHDLLASSPMMASSKTSILSMRCILRRFWHMGRMDATYRFLTVHRSG